MKTFKNLTLIILSLILLSACADAQTKRKKTNRKTPAKATKPMPKTNGDYQILAEGFYSKVETPFVFIARDAETYALLRSLVENLPPSSTLDFTKTAIVAAFAGEKNTGGYSVKIHPSAGKIAIETKTPQKGGMTAQVITSPFQVAVVPAVESQALPLEIPASWLNNAQTFRVSKADFENSGGITGQMKKFSAEGTIRVLKQNDLLTFIFNLSGIGADSSMKLSDIASGVLKEGSIEITRLDAGTFAQMPRPPLKVFGTMGDKKLSLLFESLPPIAADGYMARGKLEAVKK